MGSWTSGCLGLSIAPFPCSAVSADHFTRPRGVRIDGHGNTLGHRATPVRQGLRPRSAPQVPSEATPTRKRAIQVDLCYSSFRMVYHHSGEFPDSHASWHEYEISEWYLDIPYALTGHAKARDRARCECRPRRVRSTARHTQSRSPLCEAHRTRVRPTARTPAPRDAWRGRTHRSVRSAWQGAALGASKAPRVRARALRWDISRARLAERSP